MSRLEVLDNNSPVDSTVFSEADSSSFPLGTSRSRRRRRLFAALDATSPETEDGNHINGQSPLTHTETAADLQIDDQNPAATEKLTPNDAERILDIMEDVRPRTWLFTGDNLGFEVQQARRGWVEHFSDFIREKLERKHDVILNSSFVDSTITRLIEDIDWRVLRFQPDVVFFMPGINECVAHSDQDDFRDSLQSLVESLHDEGCMVVLNSPPCPALMDETVSERLKTAASRIRSVANGSGAVMSDHFSHWRATLQRDGDRANLHDDSGQQPSARGHRELTRRLLKSLHAPST